MRSSIGRFDRVRATVHHAVGLIARVPLYPLLLAAYAVLFVYAANIAEVVPADLIGPLAVALGSAAILLGACALIYRDARRAAILSAALIAAFAYFGHVSSMLDEAVIGETVQLAVWAGLLIVAAIYAVRARGSLPTVTATFNAFGLVLVAITLINIIPAEAGRVARASQAKPVSEDVAIERDTATGSRHLLPGLRPLWLRLVTQGTFWHQE